MGNELGKIILDSPEGSLYYNVKTDVYTLILDSHPDHFGYNCQITVNVKQVPYKSDENLQIDATDTSLSCTQNPSLWVLSNSCILNNCRNVYKFLHTNHMQNTSTTQLSPV
jgi:hypothetical protein